jgi:hypothetical protein
VLRLGMASSKRIHIGSAGTQLWIGCAARWTPGTTVSGIYRSSCITTNVRSFL